MEATIFHECRDLLNTFVAGKDPRFESFCEKWSALNFQYIYAAQVNNIELMQTTSAIFHLAKRAVCNRYTDGTQLPGPNNWTEKQMLFRLGALYLMYCVYFKQPNDKYIKVQMSLETWNELREFIDQLKTTGTTMGNSTKTNIIWAAAVEDGTFIFLKLWQSNAFRFTALDHPTGLEELVDYDIVEEQAKTGPKPRFVEDDNDKLKEALHPFMSTFAGLSDLTKLEDLYNSAKQQLQMAKNKEANKSGSWISLQPNTNIFHTLQTTFENMQTIINGEETSKAAEDNDRAKKRNIKMRSYRSCRTPKYPSDDEFLTCDEDEDLDDGSNNVKKIARRMSARTIFAEPLPSAVETELVGDDGNDEQDESPTTSKAICGNQTTNETDENLVEMRENEDLAQHDESYLTNLLNQVVEDDNDEQSD